MAVKLSVKAGSGDHVRIGVGSTGFDAEVRKTLVGVSVRNGVRVEASIASQPSMEVGSGAVCIYPEGELFPGPYRVRPTLSGFGIATEGLFMRSDMTVDPIPISEVTNESNGYTVTIG